MKKVKFITCIYTNLYGSDLGGRPDRYHHYRWSLLSLLKMSDADFVCYTSTEEFSSLKSFFYEENSVSENQLKIEIFDIWNCKYKNLINPKKNLELVKRSDRCIEIQYSKFAWWYNEDGTYENYYWIDAGLSHCGLIPIKYLDSSSYMKSFYECSLFNNNFLNNLIDYTHDKFFIIGKDNVRNFWSQTVSPKWYNNYDNSIHIIGGLFGGKREKWSEIVKIFENYIEQILNEDFNSQNYELPHEELIMSLMWVNHQELFIRKHFDIWWCPDSGPKDVSPEIYTQNKSFYRILEEFNMIYE